MKSSIRSVFTSDGFEGRHAPDGFEVGSALDGFEVKACLMDSKKIHFSWVRGDMRLDGFEGRPEDGFEFRGFEMDEFESMWR